MTRILVVEDEPSYLDPLLYQLTREGYEAHGAATGEEAWELYEEMEFDLVLLDLMLPGISGTTLCRRMHELRRVPIIMVTCGPIEMSVASHEVRIHGELTQFPLKEFEVLEYLMRNKGRVLTRQQLIGRVWGSDYVGDTKTLDVHVKRIRAKIEADPSNPALLTTVRGLGYRICDERSR